MRRVTALRTAAGAGKITRSASTAWFTKIGFPESGCAACHAQAKRTTTSSPAAERPPRAHELSRFRTCPRDCPWDTSRLVARGLEQLQPDLAAGREGGDGMGEPVEWTSATTAIVAAWSHSRERGADDDAPRLVDDEPRRPGRAATDEARARRAACLDVDCPHDEPRALGRRHGVPDRRDLRVAEDHRAARVARRRRARIGRGSRRRRDAPGTCPCASAGPVRSHPRSRRASRAAANAGSSRPPPACPARARPSPARAPSVAGLRPTATSSSAPSSRRRRGRR